MNNALYLANELRNIYILGMYFIYTPTVNTKICTKLSSEWLGNVDLSSPLYVKILHVYMCFHELCACLFYRFIWQCLTVVKPRPNFAIATQLPYMCTDTQQFQLNPSKRKVFWAPCRPRLARALLCRVQPRPTSAWRTSADWEVISLTSAIFWAFVLVCVSRHWGRVRDQA